MSGTETARAAAAELRFRRLLRAYPTEWRSEHGEALLGTLLDAAEARGEHGPTPAASAALIREGLHQRLRRALSAEVRGTVASVAVGSGVGFAFGYFVSYAWVRPDFYGGRVIAGPVWFLPAWLLLVVCVSREGRVPRLAAWAATTTVLLAVPLLQLGPFPALVRPGVSFRGMAPFRPGFVEPGALIPADSGNVAVLLVLAAVTLIGVPRRRPMLLSAVVAGVVCSAMFLVTVQLGYRFSDFSDAHLWRWDPLRGTVHGTGVPILATAAVLLLVSPVLRRHPAASLLCVLGALVLVTGVVASSLAGPIPTGV